jgi:DNA-binding XRE family transcriptional regulator
MRFRTVQRKVRRSPQELAELKTFREKMRRERPTREELLASGEWEPAGTLGQVLRELQILRQLKKAREAARLSLSEVAERSGIDKAALSRLENGHQPNPTLSTLLRYAEALGKELKWSLRNKVTKPRRPAATTVK